jgi:3-oxoacyl-[acyl-carrier-protein] synthase II
MNVLITGMGAHCALGSSTKELWDGIKKGKSGIGPIKRFDVTPFETELGGMVRGGDDFESDEKRLMSYALKAADEALKNAKIFDNAIVTLVLGTSNGVMGRKIYKISHSLSEELNLGGMVISVSTACTSSSHAIGFAANLLLRGNAKVVIAGGVDILTRDVFAGFHSLGLLSKTPCSPFSTSLGTTLGEGAAFLVMESEESAKKRGIKPIATFMGYGISADAYHDTKPDPSGSGICRAITNALRDSNLKPTDIDYINAHGTGTGANDSAEWRGIQSAFSDHSVKLPVSSSKSFLGHAQGAAGALEAVTTLIAMQHNVIPPTLNYARPRPFSPKDPVATHLPRRHITKFALSTNSAFGGINTALVFGRKDETHQPLMISPRSISVLGYGINPEEDYINRFIPDDDLRGIDISARLLAGVVAMILNNSGIQFRSKECESIGLFVGQDNLSGESVEDFKNSITERGIKHLSASAFTRMVINYPAGVCCRLFGLKGPVSAISARPESGMTAFCFGADYLAWRNDTDSIIIASVNDHVEGENKDACAVGLLLKAGDENSTIRLAGWSMSGNSENATEEALKMAKLRTGDFNSVNVTASSASPGLCALINTIENSGNVTQEYFLIKGERELNSMGIDIIIERRDKHAKGA